MSEDPRTHGESQLPLAVPAALARLGRGAEAALSATQTLGATSANQTLMIETARERVLAISGQLRELRASRTRTREALERTQLVALNASLESLRQSDPAGKAFAVVAEELRAHVATGLAALADQSQQFEELEAQCAGILSLIDQAKLGSERLADELLGAQREQQNVLREHQRILDTLGLEPEGDPRISAHLAQAAEHLDALSTALGALTESTLGSTIARRQLGRTLRQLADDLAPSDGASR